MINNPVSIEEFRTNLAELVSRVMYANDKIIIKKYNREAAVLISIDEYEKLLDPTKRFTNQEWNQKFKVLDKIRERIPEQDQDVLEKEISQAIREVRAQKNKGHAQKT